MKKIFIFILLLLFCNVALLQAQSTDALLKEIVQLLNERKYENVIVSLKENENQFKKKPEDHAYFSLFLGMAYYELGQYLEAEKSYLEAKNIIEKKMGKKHQFYQISLTKLGNLHHNMGNYTQAEKFYLESLIIGEKSGKEHSDYATSLNNLGSLYKNMGSYEKAEKFYLEALTIQEKKWGKDHLDYATILSNLGVLYFDIGNYTQAEEFYLEALTIVGKVLGKDHFDYTIPLNNLGILYSDIGNYIQAEEFYLEALTIREKKLSKEHPDYASSLNDLGVLYYKIGNYAQAEKFYLEALSIREKVLGKEHPSYAISLNNLGTLYHEMGDYVQAEKTLLKVLTMREKKLGKEHPYYAVSLNNLGNLYRDMGNYLQAEKFILEALSMREIVLGKEHPSYTISLNSLGNLYNDIGNYVEAEKHYLEALAIEEKVLGKEHPDYAISLNNLGALSHKMGDYIQAEKYYLESLAIVKEVLGKEYLDYATSLNNLSLVSLSAKEFPNALPLKTESDRIITSQVKNNFSFLSERQRSLFWDKNRFNLEATYSFAFAYPMDSITRHTYNNVLFIKNLLLSTSNEIRDAILSSGNEELINQYEQLRALRQQIDALQTKTDNYNREYIALLETKADSLDKVITIASSAYRAMKADLEIDWIAVRDNLSANEIAIEFIDFQQFTTSWTDTIRYAALLIRKGWTAPKLIPLFEQKQLEEFTRVGSSKLYSGYVGKQISKLIWQPLQKHLNDGDNIYFSPSGILHHLAIESLPLEDGSLASEKYNLYRFSSTKQLCYEHSRQAYNKAVLYGGLTFDMDDESMLAQSRLYSVPRDNYAMRGFESDTTYRSGWSPLPGTKKEIENISSTLIKKGIKTVVFEDDKGNEESFRTLSGGRNDIIHIATHGFFLPLEKARKKEYFGMLGDHTPVVDNSMRRSGLIMSGGNRAWEGQSIPEDVEDGVLTSQEIMSLDLRGADLVVLSACETGLGEVSGEGVFGLQRAFKKAGAQTLIMTLWKVSDEATQFMMSKFYSHLLSGNSKREAFLKAQAATKAKYTNPYYWAGFIMLD